MSGTRHFRVLAIGSRLDRSFSWKGDHQQLEVGINLFFTHGGYLPDMAFGKGIEDELFPSVEKKVKFYRMPLEYDDEEDLNPLPRENSTESVYLIGSFELRPDEYENKLQSYLGSLRKKITQSEANRSPITLIAQADVWRLGFKPDIQSVFLESGDFLHIYLLWDDGNLWDREAWAKYSKSRLKLAWRGSGWTETRVSRIEGGDFPYPFNDDLSVQFENNLALLAERDPDTESTQSVDQRNHDLLRTLCSYLPKVHDGEEWRTPFPNTPDEPGAPKRFHDLASLGRLERMLLLDGWLTPWQYKKAWYVQPGSLALLYWAARELKYAYTAKPELFIEHYDWSAPGWFGGHLRQKRKK